jgi:uncharacterized protein
MLTQDQRSRLLRIARDSIQAVFDGRRLQLDPGLLDSELKRPSGAFVTLHSAAGDLRGCIGSIEPVAPLCEAVASNAVNAAFRDPRFHPLQRQELEGVRLEISVMSPIEVVSSIEEIAVGRDGLIIRHRGRAGLLLPQVATEYSWDRETFLAQTCVKAGLPQASWRAEECRIERFSAEVFSE